MWALNRSERQLTMLLDRKIGNSSCFSRVFQFRLQCGKFLASRVFPLTPVLTMSTKSSHILAVNTLPVQIFATQQQVSLPENYEIRQALDTAVRELITTKVCRRSERNSHWLISTTVEHRGIPGVFCRWAVCLCAPAASAVSMQLRNKWWSSSVMK